MANNDTTSLIYQVNRSEIAGFLRVGSDLVIHMTNGGIARIDQFFAQPGGQEMTLLLQESNGAMWQTVFAQRADATVMRGYTPFTPDATMAADLSAVPLPLELAGADANKNGYSIQILGFTDDVGKDQGEDLPSDTKTDDTKPVLHGVAKGMQPNDRIWIYDGEDFLGFADVNADGTWTFAVSHRSEGLHAFSARILTAAGDEIAFSGQFLIHMDTDSVVWPYWLLGGLGGLGAIGLAVALGGGGGGSKTPPDTPGMVITDNVGDIQGSVTDGSFTDDTRPTLSGTGEDGDVIKIYHNSLTDPIGNVTVSGGKWTYTPAAELAESIHVLTVTATDAAGNEKALNAWAFTVDLTAPDEPGDIAVVNDAADVDIDEGGFTNDATPTISGTGTAGDVIRIYDNGRINAIGSTIVQHDGTWEYTTPALADGEHELTATATDAAGNEGRASYAFTLTVDTLAEKPKIDGVRDPGGTVVEDGGSTEYGTLTVSGTGTAGDLITIFDGSTALGSAAVNSSGHWNWTLSTSSTDDEYNLSATATDALGNESESSGSFTVIMNKTADEIAVDAFTYDDSTADATLTISGTDAAAGDVIGSTEVEAGGTREWPPAGSGLFTDDAGDNVFERQDGGDTFNLVNGGNDSLIYKVLVNSALDPDSGSGHDAVNGFTVGAWDANADADRIDISDLLVGYNPANGDSPVLDAGDPIRDFLSARTEGSGTIISIDRDGSGTAFHSTDLVTLNEVNTSLEELIANSQIALF